MIRKNDFFYYKQTIIFYIIFKNIIYETSVIEKCEGKYYLQNKSY